MSVSDVSRSLQSRVSTTHRFYSQLTFIECLINTIVQSREYVTTKNKRSTTIVSALVPVRYMYECVRVAMYKTTCSGVTNVVCLKYRVELGTGSEAGHPVPSA